MKTVEKTPNMITIAPIQPHQIEDAKAVISAVAQRIFEPDKSPDEFSEAAAGYS